MMDISLRVGLVLLALSWPAGPASAASCRIFEMRLMQLQAGRADSSEIRAARDALDRCQNGIAGDPAFQSDGGRPWWQDDGGSLRAREEDTAPSGPSGTYRTVCVRSCDGYYFPISFSTVKDRFADDEEACQRLCPGGNAELYYYHVRGEWPEQMRSVTGAAYTDLPNAFRYRREYDASCTCGTPESVPPEEAMAAAATPIGPIAGLAPEAAPLPEPRPAPGTDPETLIARLGGLSLSGYAAKTAAEPPSNAHSVRVILPSWGWTESNKVISAIPNPAHATSVTPPASRE